MKLLNWFLLLIFSLTLLLVSIVNAQLDIGYDDASFPRVNLKIPPKPINYSIIQTNSSDYWGGHYYTDYDLLVPYTGASGNVDLGSFNLTGDYLFGRMIDLEVETIQVDTLNSSRSYDSSLVLHLQFNNNQSIDSSQYGNDGTFEGDAHSERDILELDGVNDYVGISTIDLASLTGLTISVWVNYDSSGTVEHTIISNWEGSPTKADILFRLEPNDPPDTVEAFIIEESDILVGGTFTDLILTPNKWHNVMMVYNGTYLTASLDGIESSIIFSAPSGSFDVDSSPTNLTIGISPHAAQDIFSGKIDNVRIFNRALTQAEIQDIYEEGNKRYGYYNNLYVNELNTTGEVWHEDEVHHQGDVHFEDDVKECKGSADDVCREFNQTDLVYTAEVGSPRVIWDGFGDFIFNGGNVSIGTFGILQSGDWTYLSSDGSIEEGFDIAIPKYGNRDFYYGYGGIENHFFGNAGELKIDKDGNLITTGSGSFGGDLDVGGNILGKGDINTTRLMNATGFFAIDEHGHEASLTLVSHNLLEIEDDVIIEHTNCTVNATGGQAKAYIFNEENPGEHIDLVIDKTRYEMNNGLSIDLTEGVRVRPQYNWVYTDDGSTLSVSITEPTGEFAYLCNVYIANVTGTVIDFHTVEDEIPSNYEFIKRAYKRDWLDSAVYDNGVVPTISTNDLATTSGTVLTSMTPITFAARDTSGTTKIVDEYFNHYSDFSEVITYSDNSSIGNNKYVKLVVFGAVEDKSDVYFVNRQQSPGTEYNSISKAEVDEEQKAVFVCPSNLRTQCFLIAYVVVKVSGGSGTIQTLSNGAKYVDLRGSKPSALLTASSGSYAIGLSDVLINSNEANNNIFLRPFGLTGGISLFSNGGFTTNSTSIAIETANDCTGNCGTGEVAWNSTHICVCTSTNNWKGARFD